MTESTYSLFEEEMIPKSFPARTILYAAGAGLVVGILLTSAVALTYYFPTSSPPAHDLCILSTAAPHNATTIPPTENTTFSGVPQQEATTSLPNVTTAFAVIHHQKKKIYTVFTEQKMNWNDAWNDCKGRNMTLASLENGEEIQTVLSQVIKVGNGEIDVNFWLSGRNSGGNCSWMRMNTVHKVTYSQGTVGEPTGGIIFTPADFCIDMSKMIKNMWNYEYIPCSIEQFYICEHWTQ